MNWAGIIFLIVIGIVAVVLEFLVIPGGVVGIIGGLFMVGGVVFAYIQYGFTAGNITLAATFVLSITAIVLMLRSRTWKKLMLTTKIDSKVNEIDTTNIAVGTEGVAVSRLAPVGKGQFGDEVIEVQSSHDFVDAGSHITIIKIESNKVIVKQKL